MEMRQTFLSMLGFLAARSCLDPNKDQTCEDLFRSTRAVMGQDAGMNLAEFLTRSNKTRLSQVLGQTLSLSHQKRSRLYDSGDGLLTFSQSVGSSSAPGALLPSRRLHFRDLS